MDELKMEILISNKPWKEQEEDLSKVINFLDENKKGHSCNCTLNVKISV